MSNVQPNSKLNLKSLIQNVIARYNRARLTSKVTIVEHLEQPFYADETLDKVERKFYIAPINDEFRTKRLNHTISQFESLFVLQNPTITPFFYFQNRMGRGSINIDGEDNKFRYNFEKLISLKPEQTQSSNYLLIFPTIQIAREAYQIYLETREDLINLSFDYLSKHGFEPKKHLNKGEFQWEVEKQKEKKNNNTTLSLI